MHKQIFTERRITLNIKNSNGHNTEIAALPREAEEIFESFRSQRKYGKNEIVYIQGEPADCFYYLKRGRVRVFFNSPDGMEKTLSVAEPGNIMGEAAFFDEMPRVSSAKTITPCIIISINKIQLLNKFREKPSLAMHLLTLQARSIRMLSSHVSSITFLKADCRIAGVLLKSQTYNGSVPVVHLTHEEIGNMVGVSRVTVSKILNSFARSGYIKTGYRCVFITDNSALEEIAKSEYE